MIHMTIPEKLSAIINEFAGMFRQTPEEFVIEFLEEYFESERLCNYREICKKNICTLKHCKACFGKRRMANHS